MNFNKKNDFVQKIMTIYFPKYANIREYSRRKGKEIEGRKRLLWRAYDLGSWETLARDGACLENMCCVCGNGV